MNFLNKTKENKKVESKASNVADKLEKMEIETKKPGSAKKTRNYLEQPWLGVRKVQLDQEELGNLFLKRENPEERVLKKLLKLLKEVDKEDQEGEEESD